MATFNKIEEIQVGENFKGIINSDSVDYSIISASYNQSYSEGPSDLSMTVISSDSSIQMNEYLGYSRGGLVKKGGKQDTPFSLKNMETISIKNGETPIFTFFGFLSSYNESISAGERTYQLGFLDRSIILDKIFVGLTNRHKRVDNLVGGEADVTSFCGNDATIKTRKLIFGSKFGIGPKLNTARVGAVRGEQYLSFSYIPYFPYSKNNSEPYAGGKIIVGDEQFSENFCSVPEVDYTFKDLVDGMASANIIVTGDLAGLIRSDGIRRQYAGTLRSVLSRWCADYGYSFVWEDSSGKKDSLGIRVFDMRKGLGNIRAKKENFLAKGVQDIEYSEDRKSTESIGLVTRLVRPPSFTEGDINFSRKVKCNPVTVPPLGLTSDPTIRPKDNDSFLKSCILAKYSKDIRTLYYINNVSEVEGLLKWEALGVFVIRTNAYSFGRGRYSILRAYWMEDFDEINSEWGSGKYDTYLVYYSEDMENRHIEWEKGIADNFMGKYFVSNSNTYVNDTTSCSAIFGRRSRLADSNPEFIAFPDTEIPQIQNNPYGKIIGGAVTGSKFKKIVERQSAPWDGTFAADGETDLKSLTPRFIPVTPEAYDALVKAGVIEDTVGADFAIGGAKFQLGYLFVRKTSVLINSSNNYVNSKEIPDAVLNPVNDDSDTSKCTPQCSLDVGAYVCGESPTGSGMQPAVTTNMSFGIQITAGGVNYGTIIAPVGTKKSVLGGLGALDKAAGFNRIETINYKNFLAQRPIKRFRESVSSNLLKSASNNIIEEDMTSSVVFTADNTNKTLNGTTYVIRDGVASNLGILNADVDSSIDNYHNNALSTLQPSEFNSSKSLSVTVPGYLLEPYSVVDGISSFNFSLSGDGSSTKLTFRSMPPKKPAKDTLIREVKTITRHYRN